MTIDPKHLLAIILLVGGFSLALLVTLVWRRAKDVALFVLVFGSVLVEKVNVTFLGVEWYRGTSRGIEISALDFAPLCLLLAPLLVPKLWSFRWYWPASLGTLLAFALYGVGSVLSSTPQLYGTWEIVKMVRGLLVFVAAALIIRSRRELAIVVLALCCTACLESGIAFGQRLLHGIFRAPGTFDHENTLSTYLCTIAPVLVAASMSNWSKALRWFAGVSWLMAAGAEVLTLSRLGVPVFAVVSAGTALACTSWRLTRRKLAVMAVVTVVVSGFLEMSWDGLKARYEQGNIRAELTGRHGVETRGEYWRLAWRMAREHPAGVGLNNWSYYVSKSYGHDLGYAYRDYDEFDSAPATWEMYFAPAADSLPALALGELGFVGAVLLLAMWLRWFQMGAGFLTSRLDEDPLRRVAIGLFFGAVGIFFQSATEWTYKQTAVMFTFHVLMGALASLYSLRRAAAPAGKKASPAPESAFEILPERVAPAAHG